MSLESQRGGIGMSFLKMLSRRFMAFMSTRNGFNPLSIAMLVGSLLLQIVGSATGLNVILFLSIALYGWALFRVFSKRNPSRAAETQKFLNWWTPIATKIRQFFLRLKLRKQYKYFKCPQCGALLRMSRGAGEKDICCPKCQNRFKMKS